MDTPAQQNRSDDPRHSNISISSGDAVKPPLRNNRGSGDGDAPRDPVQAFFARFGHVIVRFRYAVVAIWLVIAVAAIAGLPSLSSVTNNNNSSFLPKDQPSIKAAALAAPFQRGTLPQAALVAARTGGALTVADNAAITRVEAAVQTDPGVVAIRDQGLSRDGEARKAQITLSANAFGQTEGKKYVAAIRATMAKAGAPAGLSFYLTGQVATNVDAAQSSTRTQNLTEILSVVFILLLLLVVYRSLLAPFLTLLPPALVLFTAGPIIAESHNLFGVAVSSITQILLTVLLLGAGTDYGLFLVFRIREEMRRGLDPHSAVIKSLSRVGETITFSAGTVIAALLCLLLATFGFYQGLGPAMAIGVAIMLLAGLTFLPALLAIFGRAAFWPTSVRPSGYTIGLYGRIAGRIVQRPLPVLLAGVALFGSLAIYGLFTYAPSGFGGETTATSSQSARGTSVISAHFPAAQANPTNLLLRYPSSVWQHPALLATATQRLVHDPAFTSINGPLDPNDTPLSATQLQHLHAVLGPPIGLTATSPAGARVSPTLYNAYRATAQFISSDGHTVQFYASLRAGAPDSTSAMHAIPAVRTALDSVGRATGALTTGVAGQAAFSYDISSLSSHDLVFIVPIVLLVIGILLAVVLRSLVAPWYLLASVGLSYLAALGLAVAVFMGIGGSNGLNFFLPFLMFIFLMALGSDYNILVMTRIREEAQDLPLREAVTRAIGATGGTVTSAGMILAGSFLVLTVSGGGQIQQIGFGIAGGILMDTFLVRTLLIPSMVVLLGNTNWWPTRLGIERAGEEKAA
jgi:putative drug exporter of the RND superfamily